MELSGITTDAAKEYQKAYGYNEIEERKDSFFKKVAKKSLSPISAMLLFASILSLIAGRDFDAGFIFFLLLLNIVITLWQENKADSAIEKLNEDLRTKVDVLRDGKWQTLNARLLVPKDILKLKSGDVIPADAKVIETSNLSVNEAALTGESLPVAKKKGDVLYSGSFVVSGIAKIEITATGNNTYFGKTLNKMDSKPKKSALEIDILRISKFLSILSVVAVVAMTIVLVARQTAWVDVLRLNLSLIIAGIPISLPTVMTLIIAFGVVVLAKKDVIVRRLSALEELANTDLLLTDKTGTLTKNQIVINEVKTYGKFSEDALRDMGSVVGLQNPKDVINKALINNEHKTKSKILKFTPADSSRKRSTLIFEESGKTETVTLGAPQVVVKLCKVREKEKKEFEDDVRSLAKRGYRTIALAKTSGKTEKDMSLVGIFALSDVLREDALSTVKFLEKNGIDVVMVTGDNRAIAKEIAGKLGIEGKEGVVTHDKLVEMDKNSIDKQMFGQVQAFAEILPEDKLRLVKNAKKYFTVASNGDGVNDLPAVKAASVGFAVKNAVDALKGAADIVLLSDGIGVMRDAIIEGRKIFERLYTYSLYRISESFRLIVTIVVLGLFTSTYPLSPLQLILIALLNDIPIISLAFNRVKITNRPSKIKVSEQFTKSLFYGLTGIANSLLLYFFAVNFLHLSFPVVQTLFFLKLTISGHLLIYVVHTKERWWKYLPSREVVVATSVTQGIATLLALSGFLMPAAASLQFVLLVWVWSFAFMQLAEFVKYIFEKREKVALEN